MFQTMNSVRTNNPSLKYLRFTLLCCKDIEIGKFKFVTKTQFLSRIFGCLQTLKKMDTIRLRKDANLC